MKPDMLRVMSYNILTGGVDDDLTSRLAAIHAVVREAAPDVLAVQEANEFELRSYQRLFAFERATGLRGFLGLSRGGYHGAIFIRPALQPVTLETEDWAANRPLMQLRLRTPSGLELTVSAVHLDPISPEVRLAAMLRCIVAPPGIVLGDFNAVRGDDPDATQKWTEFAPRQQARSGSAHADDRLFGALERATYVDIYRQVHPGDCGFTTRAAGGLRLDYIFATADLAARATRCEVIRTSESDGASDHYPVLAEFDVDV